MNNEISIIVAKSNNNVIGANGSIPWHLSGDMLHFKETTIGNIVIMGKNTYRSIGKSLPNRINVLISSTLSETDDDIMCFSSLDEAITTLKNMPEYDNKDIYLIGGNRIYNEGIKYANTMYITEVDLTVAGDTYFPDFNIHDYNKKVIESNVEDGIKYSFVEYYKK